MRLQSAHLSSLDRPVWASLSTTHSALSTGDALARRYLREVSPFASARDDTAPSLAALAALVQPGEQAFLLQVPEIVTPPGIRAMSPGKGVQMIAVRSVGQGAAQGDIEELADTDAAEMLALAKLTQPGPFLTRTHTMGRFIGIRIGGRLAAMAGERFRFPGYTEVSAVCTHPDFRGRGLARRLSATVAAAIEARGERPFLHAWRTNRAAISLYELLGFELRTEVNVAVLERHGTDLGASVAGTGSRYNPYWARHRRRNLPASYPAWRKSERCVDHTTHALAAKNARCVRRISPRIQCGRAPRRASSSWDSNATCTSSSATSVRQSTLSR